VGNELTLFMRGIVPGRSYPKRARLHVLREIVKSGSHTPPLRAFLADAAQQSRRVYHGRGIPTSASTPIRTPAWRSTTPSGVDTSLASAS